MALIALSNPLGDTLELKPQIDEAIARTLKSGNYILGPEVNAFEKTFATYCETEFGIGVASGTSALHLALLALNIGPGDEVITPSHTATATISAIVEAGGIPVYADISPNTFTLDPRSVERCLTDKTKALIAVHLYGYPAPMDELKALAHAHSIPLIEDASQAHGALYKNRKVGSLGDLSCFSFYPTKNLGAIGDAGMVCTNKGDLAKRLKLLREYGWQKRYQSRLHGINSRLDELQAAILNVKITKLDEWNQRRVSHANLFIKHFQELPFLSLPKTPVDTSPVFHQFVVKTENRTGLMDHLSSEGIQSGIHYPVPNHLQEGYLDLASQPVPLPQTEETCRKIVSLPVHQHLSEAQVHAMIAAIRNFSHD